MNDHPKDLHDRETARHGETSSRGLNGYFAARRLERARNREEKIAQEIISPTKRKNVAKRERVSRRDLLESRIGFKEVLTTILLSIVSAGITLLTYSGVSMPMSEAGADIVTKGHALSFSIVIGVLSWLGWSYLFTIIYWLRGKNLAIALTAGSLYVISIAAIDAPMNMLALAGPSAVQMSLVDVAGSYETKSTAIFDETITAQQLLPALRAQAARFAGLEAHEIETGAQSGKKGAGKVSEAFGQIAVLLANLADQIETGATRAEGLQAGITDAMSEMKRHIYTSGNIRDRSQAVSASADKVDQLLGRIGQYDYTASIRATLGSLSNLFPHGGAAGSEFEATQNAELVVIGEMAKPVAAVLQDALDNMAPVQAAASGTMRPADPMSAIRTYWWPLLPQWIAAVFVDLSAALLLVVLIAARREADELDKIEIEGDEK